MRSRILAICALAVGAALTARPGLADPVAGAPKITVATVEEVPAPYDEAADAGAQLDAAIHTAKRTHKRLLIEFGANWCPDCRIFAGVTRLDPVQTWLAKHYEIVTVDVGHFKKNRDVAARYGLTVTAIPAVVVATAGGTVLNGDEETALSDARHMTPQAIVDLLARWTALRTPG